MNLYYYLYYKIYKWFEHSSIPWWSDVKSTFLIATIEMVILALAEYKITSLLTQGADAYGKWSYILIIGVPPLVFNYFLFLHYNRWKEIVYRFDKFDKQEKNKMNLHMTILVLLVATLFAFLFSL